VILIMHHLHPHSAYESFVHLKQAITIKKFMVMEASATICNNSLGSPFIFSSSPAFTQKPATFSPMLVKSMATPKPLPSVSKTVGSRKVSERHIYEQNLFCVPMVLYEEWLISIVSCLLAYY